VTPYLLVSGDFVKTGGMDRANYALASNLARSGHPVYLVTHRADSGLAAQGVSVHRVPKPFGSYFLGGPLLDLTGRVRGRTVWNAGGRVVVNAGNCGFGDVSWVHYVHSAYRTPPGGPRATRLRRGLMRWFFVNRERRCLRRARFVIANSQRTRNDLVELLGLPPERISVVYYGNDPEQFRPAGCGERDELRRALGFPTDRPLVVFIGALGDRRKGFDVLFEAWSRLCSQPEWDPLLLVVGSGGDLPAWRERAVAAGLTHNIRFLGFRDDVPAVLRSADALVSPTRYEAYGLGVHEALCCGLPAFVSRTAGVAERYPADLSILLLPDDAGSIGDRLREWRGDMATFRASLDRFSADLRGFTWDDMASTILRAIAVPETHPQANSQGAIR